MEKVKWGVLGTAGIARQQTIPGMIQAENSELYAVAGRSLEKAEAYKNEFGFSKAYGSYEDLLADPEVLAVYLPLPNELHYEWALKALRAKKHVLCEKPLAASAAQIEEMVTAANDNGVLLMEAFAYLHSPLIAAVKAELDGGAIGDVLYMESDFVTSDYDPCNIRMRRETNGGAAYDLGCYCASLILWMLGEEPERVQAVSDFSGCGVDRYTSALLSFPGGKTAAFSCGMVLPTGEGRRIDRFRIHGTRGFIRCDAQFNEEGELSYTLRSGDMEIVKTVYAPQNYRLEIEQFGRCILNGETPRVSNDFSLSVGRTLDKILDAIHY